MRLQNIFGKKHHLAVRENDFTGLCHNAQAVGVAVKRKPQFRVALFDGTDQVLEVCRFTRIGMVMREVAVHIEKELRHAAAEFGKDAPHHGAGDAVTAVKGNLHGARELYVRGDFLRVGVNDAHAFNRGGRLGGLITVFADRAVNVLDAFAKEGFAPEHHLETVIFRGIVGARDRHTRAVFKVVCGKVQNRRRNAADINHFRARGGNALHEALREFGPRNAAVPAHAKGVNTRIACHRPQHQPHGIGDFRSECLTDNAADIVGFENALFGRHSIYYHH